MNIDTEENLEHHQFEELIQGLIDDDYGCCNDFIAPSTVIGLSENIQRLNASGNMMSSGVGNNSDFQKNKSIRGDHINWIADQSVDQFEMIYLKKIGNFISHLNSTCFTAIKSFESHYSSYEKKNFYARHLDQFKTEKGRKFSIVLYLNKDWKEKDGGMLALHPKGEAQINISPLGGRMVFFRSDEMEHEVQASETRERRSIAGWLKN
ncbi:MAG: 2OG-Fe(II) oxygenase [Algoriphagus sp.]|uniref:2OG-Fe(II) oxygenase n=1 Tax=Algoriphagus sp. TaxID=1872435 RepID=UPI0026079063|nr:2OG-Fe(II) oxygenase [Algoriphagus sp.]MDG1276422.1 2OG-Fe(II) oxygenase [Algoriphagus sp.]